MNQSKTLLQILTEARELVSRGWMQGHYYDPETHCYCATGAIMRAVGYLLPVGIPSPDCMLLRESMLVAIERMERAMPQSRFPMPGYLSLACWNDQPTTTQADVVALFDRAIVGAQA